ncbi:MAG TPA: EcsC family protein [Candidatus Hungatella pullicola]|nr:EcsC family protein [Candidatus Hungatella pullicola]
MNFVSGFGGKKTPWDKEWNRLIRDEAGFCDKQQKAKTFFLKEKLEGKVPPSLEETLNSAFCKAFQIIFEKGTSVIEKTCQKEKKEYDYKLREYGCQLKNSRKNLKAFSKSAGMSAAKNVAVSAAEGIGTGFFGVGIPDIFLFTAMIFKSIYEIALSYGFSYDTPEEQIFILRLILASVTYGEEFKQGETLLNQDMEESREGIGDRKRLLSCTAQKLADELLYMKFIQGIPVIGVAGGVMDCVYLKRITDYAGLKYRRRFLIRKRREQNCTERNT